ncbi:RNA polymerase factor sigma-54 [Sediminicurvatus halobius]|uniref:RNA polymerase sigma-54 factor n=1 Tax=Sediminicurvatus halobius TaxID=2182432 RepID=A0A2U2N7P5_9GAMM|nr:RNA polymerase factor sigma-54 [Spiribacter halobius]PWG65206.1 RNA polymerase factor sigma-54 [Spiribacter halobius]UEX78839.1 RNA polymerase factor sigma-54 [Spiribacter halobius]
MKQSLQLRLGQQLTMTPQLQQAIRLLQLPTLELRMEIQQALESNLMLEAAEEAELEAAAERDEDGAEASEAAPDRTEQDLGGEEPDAARLTEDLPVDSSWEDVYDGSTTYSHSGSDDERDLFENQSGGEESLRDYLIWQLQMAPISPRDMAIAEAIVDAVRDDGYLGEPLEEIGAGLPPELEVEPDDLQAVLARVQRLDPVGVAARDVREALLVQLDQLDPATPHLAAARELVDQHLELLVSRQFAQLKRRMRLDLETLQAALALVQTLDPRPGARFSTERTEYVVPDVFVRRVNGDWQVEVNPDACPRLRVNSYYASLVRRADNSRDNSLMRQHLQEARWLIKSLRSRNDTLLKVAECIVERQRGFLEQGEEAMQPLVLREVAETIEMHESTVSRITNQKYMHTPRGTFEFKYFFSSHVQTVDGGECSATAIRARIRRLVADEDPASPLSDSRLAEILREEGINVARRTVAKYREAMAIASSTERKRLA